MSKCVTSCVQVVSASLLVTAIMLGTDRATRADDCLAAPSRPPAPGGHWYYHLDHATDRKCWYLVEPRAPTAEAAEPQPSEPPPPPTFGSFFSSLGFTGSTRQPDPTTGDARILQPARADERSDDATGRQPRVARQPVTEASLVQKPHRPPHARPPAEHDEPAASPTPAERDALFQEFLKWRERQ
jgi:hypothetical protein